ncbi:hypothetical protein A9200_05825 [Maribacter hydrothermalis]|uniref:Uncharacterized protein n=4 Tax=Flavobacteriaceae TaxID=49546 RepID=A0A1B7Z8W5_9FLAO|nr:MULTISPECIES: hypothetical protein [Flavobacteriaceae]APQ18808.1 hypothetical protein BTR34_16450 [Maribacter hydrothermalis]OBR39178.1 hypothetical protein A9200_05825 [Maribacter hydrothermalis]SFD41821.1 hypothetical protein SAMN04487987_11334 [Algibacter pectinivorans]
MNHLLAKKTGRNGEYVKMISDEDIFNLPDDLDNPHEYDTDYKLEDDEWFGIEDFSETDFCIDILTTDFNSAEYNQIALADYNRLKYLCSYQDNQYYYFQKLSRSQTIRRKWFTISNQPEIQNDNPIIILKELPDAIYDSEEDILYFKKLTSITTIFSGIGTLYREATQEDTEQFLENEFINLTDDYDASKVKKANRKRIAMAMDTFNAFNPQQRNSIYDYIKEYCNDLEFSDEDRNFNIGSEENLKQLMYGIEQRYYTTPIGNEKRLANSITTI